MTINTKPATKLAISIGEPAGIGPDLLIKLCQNYSQNCKDNNNKFNNTILIAFCDPNLLYQRAKLLNLNIEIINIKLADIKDLNHQPEKSIYVVNSINNITNIDHADLNKIKYEPGLIHPTNINTAKLTLEHLNQATMACLNNYCDALVTCPIQKSVINTINKDFSGHTEYLEDICNNFFKPSINYKSVMLLMSEDIKTALITTHIPLHKVSSSINKDKIIKIANIINTDLKTKFNITNPHILITGLNPHAGEDGNLGTEEQEIIIPAIQYLQQQNINISGPYAADSIFSKKFEESEVILAMYHDQGLTGFKARAFNKSANVTLGLPLIRTSVDHGTAIDLAGTGNINTSSLEFAIKTAVNISNENTYEPQS